MRLSYIATVLLSFGLGFPLLTRYPFRPDEAIYSVWALHFWQDPFFLTVWPDKPPLYLSVLALAYKAFGVSEASARWLNISFTTLTVALVITSARHIWGARAALLAGLTLALNPFALSFAATAYTDPLLVLMGSAALYAALRRRSYWSGFWLGLAMMTKQQGLFYVPLVLGALLLSVQRARYGWPRWRKSLHELAYFGGGVATMVAPIVYWDSLRWATAPSPWDLSIRNYGGVALTPLSLWLERTQGWAALAWYLLASQYVWFFVALSLLYSVARRVSLPAILRRQTQVASLQTWGRSGKPLYNLETSRAERNAIPSARIESAPERRVAQADSQTRSQYCAVLFSVWGLGFMAIHVITNIQVWDRYLLPLAPIGALLWGGCLAGISAQIPAKWARTVIAAWLLLLLPPAFSVRQGHLPVGADHGDYAGLPQAVQWLEQNALGDSPAAKIVLYHNVLGWHFQFYLHQQIEQAQVELRWFPNALYLAQNSTTAPHMRKFLVTPSWAPARDLARFAAMLQVQVVPRASIEQIRIVELRPLSAGSCDWCYCDGWPDNFPNAVFRPMKKRHQ